MKTDNHLFFCGIFFFVNKSDFSVAMKTDKRLLFQWNFLLGKRDCFIAMRTDKHLFFLWNFISGKSDFSVAMKTNKCLVQYRSKVG